MADEFLRLSEITKDNRQAATYYRQFVKAAQRREFVGVVLLAEVLKLPAAKKGGKPREVADYAVMQSPEFQQWHSAEVARESGPKNSGINAPTFAELVAGKVDAEKLSEATLKVLDERTEKNRKNAERLRAQRKTSNK